MKLFTFQPLFVWESLKELGYFHPFHLFEQHDFLQDEFNEHWGFKQSYIWLREKMLEKGIHYDINHSHLIWAWYQWNGTKQPKPDKRYASVFNYFENTPYVMLELNVEPERVCLTDYDAWHFVLNYWLLSHESEINSFEKQFNYYREKPLKDTLGHQTILNSWNTIFDLNKSPEILEYSKEQQQIQATFFELFYTDIEKVHFFNQKKCNKILKIEHKM